MGQTGHFPEWTISSDMFSWFVGFPEFFRCSVCFVGFFLHKAKVPSYRDGRYVEISGCLPRC